MDRSEIPYMQKRLVYLTYIRTLSHQPHTKYLSNNMLSCITLYLVPTLFVSVCRHYSDKTINYNPIMILIELETEEEIPYFTILGLDKQSLPMHTMTIKNKASAYNTSSRDQLHNER